MALQQPDFGVLRKAQRGDERAFTLIVRTYEGPVFNYVLRLVGDRALAEDLTQEVFLRVFQGLPGFSLRCRFTTWLFQVTKNRVLDELRAVERRPRTVVTLDDLPPLEVLDQPFERMEAIDAVWRAVDDLNVARKLPRGRMRGAGKPGGADGSPRSSAASAAADGGRYPAFRARQRMTTSSSGAGTAGASSRTGVTTPSRCSAASSASERAAYGT